MNQRKGRVSFKVVELRVKHKLQKAKIYYGIKLIFLYKVFNFFEIQLMIHTYNIKIIQE